jgi:imidazoleglycerol-phosphate dehydratase/histidinol-phosphatase
MKKNLIIDFNGAVLQKANGTGVLKFVPAVIHNLHRASKQLDYTLLFVLPDDMFNHPDCLKAIEILQREEIIFRVIENFSTANNHERNYVVAAHETEFNVALNGQPAIKCHNWNEIYSLLKSVSRKISHSRKTNETSVEIELSLDGTGQYHVNTGLAFFNHMLEQFAKHSGIDMTLNTKGDLHVDEHHTIEDTAITLGEAIVKALDTKKGIERYGFLLPMDDSLAQVAIDFGGRNWLVWDAEFKREYVGDMPTEMFYHFFKSFSDAAKCNLNIKVEGDNEHHKIESIFKAFAKAVKMAIAVNENSDALPTTKGIL